MIKRRPKFQPKPNLAVKVGPVKEAADAVATTDASREQDAAAAANLQITSSVSKNGVDMADLAQCPSVAEERSDDLPSVAADAGHLSTSTELSRPDALALTGGGVSPFNSQVPSLLADKVSKSGSGLSIAHISDNIEKKLDTVPQTTQDAAFDAVDSPVPSTTERMTVADQKQTVDVETGAMEQTMENQSAVNQKVASASASKNTTALDILGGNRKVAEDEFVADKQPDAVDGCKEKDGPPTKSPPGVTSRIPHRFTKMRPNLSENLKHKRSMAPVAAASASISATAAAAAAAVTIPATAAVPTPAAATEEPTAPAAADAGNPVSAEALADEPFVPASVAREIPVPGLEPAAADDSIAQEESVSIISPEKAEKVASKIIARKLRQKREKRAIENLSGPIDSTKICMRDLIYMNPVSNPMKSSDEPEHGGASAKASSTQKTPAPPMPSRTALATVTEVEDEEDEDDPVAVPQIKIGPDGSIIINESSLVVRHKPVETFDNMEAIDETDVRYGYPKKNRTRSWTAKETTKFFAALSMIGTDFSLMCRLFPSRDRADLKRKFKREEKVHRAMVEMALKNRRTLDISLLAEPCSDDEDIKPVKLKQPGKRATRTKKQQVADNVVDQNDAIGGKENDPQPPLVVKAERKRKCENDKPSAKKPKKKKVPTATLR